MTKFSSVPNPWILVCVIAMNITAAIGFFIGHVERQKEIDALKAEYARQDEEAAHAVENLTKDLKAQCDEDIQYILNNRQGAS